MTSETVSGPDLQEGISVNELADGGMMAGHVGEAAVLLARKGEELFALDAFCTHYHGPLAEGLIVGETLMSSLRSRPTRRALCSMRSTPTPFLDCAIGR